MKEVGDSWEGCQRNRWIEMGSGRALFVDNSGIITKTIELPERGNSYRIHISNRDGQFQRKIYVRNKVDAIRYIEEMKQLVQVDYEMDLFFLKNRLAVRENNELKQGELYEGRQEGIFELVL